MSWIALTRNLKDPSSLCELSLAAMSKEGKKKATNFWHLWTCGLLLPNLEMPPDLRCFKNWGSPEQVFKVWARITETELKLLF